MGKSIILGVDVGNSDTKTQNTTTNSGFCDYAQPPYGASEILFYNGRYYVPTFEKFPYVKDKTENDHCFILTLFGIAKEILYTINKSGIKEADAVQEKVSKYTHVDLGIGLPPSHLGTLADKTIKYYQEMFELCNGVSFSYQGYQFHIELRTIRLYPQDFAAAATYVPKRDDFLTKKFSTYYAIDIGGYTVDVVPIVKKMPDVKNCKSLELGVLKMFDEIIGSVDREYGITLTPDIIEDVLQGENTILESDVEKSINDLAADWVVLILNTLRQKGLEFNTYPVLFLGGGSCLFRKRILACGMIRSCDFIQNPRANAAGYKKLLEIQLKEQK